MKPREVSTKKSTSIHNIRHGGSFETVVGRAKIPVYSCCSGSLVLRTPRKRRARQRRKTRINPVLKYKHVYVERDDGGEPRECLVLNSNAGQEAPAASLVLSSYTYIIYLRIPTGTTFLPTILRFLLDKLPRLTLRLFRPFGSRFRAEKGAQQTQ